VCNKLGFADLGFIGLKNDYKNFTNKSVDTISDKVDGCIPEYKVAGAICNGTNFSEVSYIPFF